MKNNKGYTLTELLAVLTIMGILTMIAVPTLMRYLTNARTVSTDTMLKSSYESAEEYIMKNNIFLTNGETYEIKINDLVEDNLLEPLVDPRGNSARCDTNTNSKVVVTRGNNTEGNLINYTYKVTIICPQSGTIEKTFPE